jgi:hypothetical protein
VRARPAHDRQAAGALVAARRRARVAEQGVAHTPGGDGARKRRGRDELVALAVGEDQHRPPVARDERAGLGRRADGELVGGARVVGAQEVRERRDARRRHRARAPRHLGAVVDRGDRAGEREREDGAEGDRRGEADPRQARAGGEGNAGPQAGCHRRVDAGQVARPQARQHGAQSEAGDEPQREREQPAAADAVEPAPCPERERDGERRERGDGLDADPAPEMRLRGEQPQRPGWRGAASDSGRVLARAASERGGPRQARRDGSVRRVAARAQEPLRAVVDQGRAPGRAVRRAEGPRARVQRHGGDDHEPRERAGDEGAAEGAEAERARPPAARAGQHPQRHRGADWQQRLGELDLEGEAEQRAGPDQGPRRKPPAAGSPCDDRGAGDGERGHDRVHRVAARDDHGGRRHRQRDPARERGRAAEQRAQQPHQRRDERHAAQRLREQERHAVEAEQPRGGDLEPQVDRRLVDRHAPPGLERAAHERRPRRAHAAHGGVVVGVGGDAAERDHAQRGREREDRCLRPATAPSAAHYAARG